MNNWKIYSLYYGKAECPKEVLTAGVDVGLKIWVPYMGYLLDNGSTKILVDTGIHERFIVDGKAWGGLRAEAGSKYVSDSLEKIGVKPDDIEMVLYTHLHNDHAGASHLFKNSLHVFQDDEWKNLVDPIPAQKLRGDYDPGTIPVLQESNCLRVFGDGEIMAGIKFYKSPGHTLGSMVVAVETQKGVYVITGDTAILKHNLFPKMDKMVLLDGKEIKITPAPDVYGPAIPSGIVYNYYAWYQSIYRLKLLVKDEEYALTGHDPSLVNRVFPE
jgi:N-acyl homoserine lactone hydrolase